MKFRLLEIGRVARAKGPVKQDKLKQRYPRLLDATSRVVGQARRFSQEIAQGVNPPSADKVSHRPADWAVIPSPYAAGMVALGTGQVAFDIGRREFISVLGITAAWPLAGYRSF